MNKYSRIAVVFIVLSIFNVYALKADQISTFVTNINSAWVNTNYAQILQLANDRLGQNPNDLLALGVKQEYYIDCEINTSNAHAVANALLAAANQIGRADIIFLAEETTRFVMDMPENATGSYTQAQIQLRHNEFNELFPGIFMPVLIARQLEKPATNYPTLTVDSMPTNGIFINISEADDFERGSTNTPYVRVYRNGKNITVTAPPSFGTNTFLRWSSDGTNTLGTTTNITVSITNNIKTIAVYGNSE